MASPRVDHPISFTTYLCHQLLIPSDTTCEIYHQKNVVTLLIFLGQIELTWPGLVDPLVVGRVIRDMLDMFVPVAELTVHYGSKQVSNGCELKPSYAAAKPTVRITGSHDRSCLYTLVMAVPDAPRPSEPTFREWLHWIVVNIPEGGEASDGKELVPYMGPQPLTGIHRYVFSIFKQKDATEKIKTLPKPRNNFSTRQFASENELGLLVAAVYFNSQKKPSNKKR